MSVQARFEETGTISAEVCKALGIDYTKEYISNIGRPLRIVPDGKPLAFL